MAEQAKTDDLVVFAPAWGEDPVGRLQFGSDLATVEREARPDASRFARAFEVASHGGRTPELDGWRSTASQRFGALTVTTLENPAPVQVLGDLVSLATPEHLRVARVDGGHETDCPFTHAQPQSGGLGFGPAIPADRFVCPGGGFAGVSVAADLSYRPRRCIYAPAIGGNAALRLASADVEIGQTLHGHHALYVEAEPVIERAPR